MSRQDYSSLVTLVNRFKKDHKDELTGLMWAELDTMLEVARSGDRSYGDLLDQLREYEANFGHGIAKEYIERKRQNNR